jgi:RND family efflux transporter MFP subunit
MVLALAALASVVAVSIWVGRHWLVGDGAGPVEITACVTRALLPITITERGEIESSDTEVSRCEVEGYQNKLVTILAEGTHVKKDEVVASFDSDELKRKYDEQEVKWRTAEGKAKAARGELEVQKNKADGEIAKAKLDLTLALLERDKYLQGDYKVEHEELLGDIEMAKKDLHETAEKLENLKKLVKKGYNTPEQQRLKELELAKNQYVLASKETKLFVLEKFTKVSKEVELKAKAEDAERGVARAKNSGAAAIDKAQSDFDASEVTARLEKSALDRLKRLLDKCTLKAPHEGILVYAKEYYYEPQSRIQPGAVIHFQQPIFSLPDMGKMQVKVNIHEAVVKKTKVGQKAEIHLDALPNIALHGTVKNVAPLAQSQGFWERGVKEYVTIVTIDDLPPEAGLKPGMTAEVKIMANQLPDVLVVPVQCVTEYEGKHCSYVAGAKGIERRDVTVGENNEKFVEIKEGLAEAERVTLDARIRMAAEVKARESSPESLKQAPPAGKAPATVAKSVSTPAPAHKP